MRILRPNGRRRLDEQVIEACQAADGRLHRCLLVLVQGRVGAETLEPFATLEQILGEALDGELRIVITDEWPEAFWQRELDDVLVAAEVEGSFEFHASADQQRRARTQRVEDGSLEVLFLERGRVRGSALTLVDRRREDGRPLSMNQKLAALELLQQLRDVLGAPRDLQKLVTDAREALGMPAGRVTSVAHVRRERGEKVSVESIGDQIRRLTSPQPAPAAQPPAPPRSRTVLPGSPQRAAAPVAAPAQPQGKKAPAEERHALAGGKCERCGKAGRELEGPCGRPELGRIGVIELD